MLTFLGIDVIQVITVIVVLVATYVLARLVTGLFSKIFVKTSFPEKIGEGIVRISKYAIYIIGVFVAASYLGVDLSSVIIGLGAFSIAISFAVSNVVQNFVSGILVQADKTFKVGDQIRVQSYEGKVVKMSVRTTLIETENGDIISIPNSIFLTNPVINIKTNKKL